MSVDTDKLIAELREALSGLTQLEMASRGMIPVSRAMVEAHEAYTKLCSDRDNIRSLLDRIASLENDIRIGCANIDKEIARANAAEGRIASLEAALVPFAKYMDGGMDRDNKGEPLPDERGVGWVYLTVGDFRRAARLSISKQKEPGE